MTEEASGGIVIVGSVNVDLVISVDRLPSPGETVLGGTFSQNGGGKGANKAVAAARLGGRTWLVGATGSDRFAELARDELADAGVDLSHLAAVDVATGIAQILVDAAGENVIAVASGANAELDPGHVRQALESMVGPGWVVVANLEIPDDAVLAAAETAEARGARFILDPAPARPLSPRLISLCDTMTPNEHEADVLCDALGLPKQPPSLLEAGVRKLIITRGPDGADLYAHGTVTHQASIPVAAIDSTGAGDAFAGALAWAYTEGMTEREALRAAAAAGALATRGLGARSSLPTGHELRNVVATSEASLGAAVS